MPGHPTASRGRRSYHRQPQFPPAHAGRGRNGNQPVPFRRGRPVLRRDDDWRSWQELSVRVTGLQPGVTTLALHGCFATEGVISAIDIQESRGGSELAAVLTFCPPPTNAFWERPQNNSLRIDLLPKKRSFLHPSPIDPSRSYPERMRLFAEVIRFGFMHDQDSMMPMRSPRATEGRQIEFTLDLLRRQIDIRLNLETTGNFAKPRWELIRFNIPFAQMNHVHQIKAGHDKQALIIPLSTPPAFFRKDRHIEATHDDQDYYWSDMRTWLRQTDIVRDRDHIKSAPVTLQKYRPIIDIGRWTTYYFAFEGSYNTRITYSKILQALSDYNIKVERLTQLKILERREPDLWNWIDNVKVKSAGALSDLQNNSIYLPFQVRYQLEVCLSHGYLNEHNISRAFLERLTSLDASAARNLLEKVADAKTRVFEPMEIFGRFGLSGPSQRTIPRYCTYTRAATVTPSMIYYASPTVEISNRVIRQYQEFEDRFMRVKFTDEKSRGRINAQDDDSQDEVFTRIKRTMTNGITIGDRHFEFLAFGNSQFREHGAYFFASTDQVSAADIRAWMGDFSHIRTVAKWAARLGQCFSTTRAITGTRVKVLTIPDVKRNNYTFTDGVGKISPFLAQMIAGEFNLPAAFDDPPSLFQFRLGGCKGVLAVAPDARHQEVYIRKSQYKFPAKHEGLEIIRTSSFAAATLNRQIIIVLSTLGVEDEVFTSKLHAMLAELRQAVSDEKVALRYLQKYVDLNQMTLTVAGMILDGFMAAQEPFLMSILQLWRAWNIKYLKEKARILIDKGAFVLGCVDETATLRGYYESQDHSPATYPQIFLRVPNTNVRGQYTIITGTCILARNPSLHPGDVRIVEAVDVPQLHHLKNVVVFPQTGDRDVANMCSGGDLDGDDYLVMWDEELMPAEINHAAMNYEAQKPVVLDREVTVGDITSFFVLYMKNDKLGAIANAHLAHADNSESGVKDEKCLRLAQLHSDAVDYPKSGIPARMTRDLRPRRWPHFMEKRKDSTYQSTKVLGQLYDQVERADFVPMYDQPFDERILNAYELDQKLLQDAAEIKELYDAAIRRIMAQHGIRTEFEVWSTFVMAHNMESKDYKFGEEIGNLSRALKDRFQDVCTQKAGGRDFSRLGPFVAAMYTVTAQQVTAAVATSKPGALLNTEDEAAEPKETKNMPLMSFPWIFVSELGKIALGDFSRQDRSLKVEQGEQKRVHVKQSAVEGARAGQRDVETDHGIAHPGDLLELFEDSNEASEPLSSAEHLDSPTTEVAQEPVQTTMDTLDLLSESPPEFAAWNAMAGMFTRQTLSRISEEAEGDAMLQHEKESDEIFSPIETPSDGRSNVGEEEILEIFGRDASPYHHQDPVTAPAMSTTPTGIPDNKEASVEDMQEDLLDFGDDIPTVHSTAAGEPKDQKNSEEGEADIKVDIKAEIEAELEAMRLAKGVEAIRLAKDVEAEVEAVPKADERAEKVELLDAGELSALEKLAAIVG